MVNLATRIYTRLYGRHVGTDQFGNKYYTKQRDKVVALGSRKKEKRWVVYNGIVEPSKVPPLWHSWLHYSTDELPRGDETCHKWQKEHTPNLTGTEFAHLPNGHLNKGGQRDKATGDYEAWKPQYLSQFHIFFDLVFKLINRREFFLRAEELKQRSFQNLAIQVALKIRDMHFAY
jgi:NADH:ubiquinone oxidoreductase subunit